MTQLHRLLALTVAAASFAVAPSVAPAAATFRVDHPAALTADAGGRLAAALQAPNAPGIIGGQEAAAGAWPWTVFLILASGNQGVSACTGSVIGEHWILTAAHCVFDANSQPPPNRQMIVILGRHDWANTSQGSVQVADLVVTFSDYDPARHLHDLAFLHLPASAGQPGVRLATQDDAGLWRPGSTTTLAGWGWTRPADPSSGAHALQQIDLPVMDDAACRALPGYAAYDSTYMLCAGNGLVAGGCHGDSGGPWVAADGFGGYEQIATTDWGSPQCDQPNAPTIGMRLAYYTPLIVAYLVQQGQAAAPGVATGAATAVAATTATLSGTVNPAGLATDYRIQYGPTAQYGAIAAGAAGTGGPVPVTAAVSGLAPGTTYHYRVVAVNAAGAVAGADATFTTAAAPTAPAAPPPAAPAPPAPIPPVSPAPPAVIRGLATAPPLASTRISVDHKGVARLTLVCPKTAVKSCLGKLTLRGAGRTFGSRTFSQPSGRRFTLAVTLVPRGRALVSLLGKVKATAIITATDATGTRRQASRSVMLQRAAGARR